MKTKNKFIFFTGNEPFIERSVADEDFLYIDKPPSVTDKESVTVEKLFFSRYRRGMSLTDIYEEVQRLGYTNYSEQKLADLLHERQCQVAAWLEQPLNSVYWVIWIDALVFKVFGPCHIFERIVCPVIGLNDQGQKEMLGLWVGQSDDVSFGENIIKELKIRGVRHVSFICADQIPGLSDSLPRFFPESSQLLYVLNRLRNSSHFVGLSDKNQYRTDLNNILSSRNEVEATERRERLRLRWGNTYPYAVRLWRDNIEELDVFFKIPFSLRRQICRFNNMEPFGEQIRRYIKSKLSFPTLDELRMLAFYSFRELENASETSLDDWMKIRKHFQKLCNK